MAAEKPKDGTLADGAGEAVTLLFTDVEGSTRLWERNPAEMRVALARHDALLAELITRHGGIVFKTVGDAYCAAFQQAVAALAAAHAVQRALADEPWPPPIAIKVRVALHTGAVEVRDNDYFGPPLNRLARLLSAAHGGQVLLSLATKERVGDALPAGLTLRDMGKRWLKDLIRPERVFQLLAADLTADFPPLNTLDARAHNLPIQATSFVGREHEIEQLKTLPASTRMVTLTGAGGAGKTRLALQVGAERIDEYADGVWLVELAPLTDARLVPQAVATVLGVREEPGIELADTLVRELGTRELLLILDNCEHVIDASAQLCQALLARCAGVRILATSREALRVSGEAVFRVPALATPDPRVPQTTAALSLYSAVQLFIDRARSVAPTFRLDERSAPAVASICHRLDGIPLAIELAAARIHSLSVDDVNQRLDQRFRLLTAGARTAMPRQQTLRAAIDWSYELLGRTEQTLLCRLSVFANGWTLAAAEAICADDDVEAADMLDLLTSLADKSLVLAEESDGSTRYRMLETVRQYALQLLEGAGDAERPRVRHLAHFVTLAEEAETHSTAADQQAWLDRLELEHDNVRVALSWSARDAAHAVIGLRLASALWWFWQVRGYSGEGRSQLAALLAKVPETHDAAVRAKALRGAGILAWHQGDYPAAQSRFEQTLPILEGLGDRRGVARSLGNLGILAREKGDLDAAETFNGQSLSIRRELGDRWGTAAALCNLGLVAHDRRDHAAARALFEECIPIFREAGDQRSLAGCLNNLGEVANAQGDHPSAKSCYTEALSMFRALDDRRGIAITLTGLGGVAAAAGDLAGARAMHSESLVLKVEVGDRRGIAISLASLAQVHAAEGAYELAARLWGHAEATRAEIEAPSTDMERSELDRQVAAARTAFADDAAFDRAWQQGQQMTASQAIESALEQRAP
jgi:predicted ATPase/class 3 adenylate cyclase